MALIGGLATAAGKVAGLSAAAKASAGLAVVLASIGTAGAAGALPDPAQNRFDTVVESVTGDETSPAGPASENAEFGQQVSEDARDGGVDGAEISEQARQQGDQHRPDQAPVPVEPGRPTDLPIPDDAPGTPPTDPGSQRPTLPPRP